jgi:hypothetical protein
LRRFGDLAGRGVLLAQLFATVAALAWVPGNWGKLAVMLATWALGFGKLRRAEVAAMAAVDLLFVGLNWAALRRGIFTFDRPDFLGMPIYEFVIWGFYTLHAIRFLDGGAPGGGYLKAVTAAAAFSLSFGIITAPGLLLAASASVLVLCFILFHEREDLIYAGYMCALGAVIEYVGVASGQWHYPGHPGGGVAFWFVTMWSGIGLFTRRLLLPPLLRQHHGLG